MRRISAVVAALLLVSLSFASPSSAAMRWGGQVFGGFNTHSMDDWNDVIDDSNSSSGSNFDNINNGFSFGAGPTVIVNDNWMFGAHYERLMASKSEDSGLEIKPEANAFGVTGMYLFPSAGAMNYGLGVGVDYMTLAGKLSDPTDEADIEGSGVGFQILGQTNYAFSPMFSGGLNVGYRFADIDIDKIGGVDNTSSSPLQSENYSGVVLRASLSISAPKQ